MFFFLCVYLQNWHYPLYVILCPTFKKYYEHLHASLNFTPIPKTLKQLYEFTSKTMK